MQEQCPAQAHCGQRWILAWIAQRPKLPRQHSQPLVGAHCFFGWADHAIIWWQVRLRSRLLLHWRNATPLPAYQSSLCIRYFCAAVGQAYCWQKFWKFYSNPADDAGLRGHWEHLLFDSRTQQAFRASARSRLFERQLKRSLLYLCCRASSSDLLAKLQHGKARVAPQLAPSSLGNSSLPHPREQQACPFRASAKDFSHHSSLLLSLRTDHQHPLVHWLERPHNKVLQIDATGEIGPTIPQSTQ